MLVIYKGNIALKVVMDGRAVRIQPIVGRFDNPQLLNTLARNEELLAQVHLSQHQNGDTPACLARYFEEKGWLVTLKEQTPSDPQTGAWAES